MCPNKYHIYTTGLCFILPSPSKLLFILIKFSPNICYIYDKVNNNVDGRLLWDVLKIEIREATIIYGKSKSKFKREARRSLDKELQDLSSHRDSYAL
jgi:hypothetical protein